MNRLATAFLLACLLTGCDTSSPYGGSSVRYSQYTVKLISPDGKVHRAWTVSSIKKPRVKSDWGGCTILRDDGYGSYHEWEREIVAPSGWLLDVEEVHP